MTDETASPTLEETPPPVRRGGRLHPAAWVIVVSLAVVLVVAVALAALRYGLVSSPGRLFIEAQLDGLKVGRMGRLQIRGIEGDIFDDFTVRRLTISDEEGVWLEAHDLAVDWNYTALLGRRFHADEVSARLVRVLRRPTMEPKTVDKGMPVSFDIDAIRATVETLPAFSYRRGLFQLDAELDIARNGPNAGAVRVRSLLHEGDFLNAAFSIGDDIRLDARASESAGGALAGSLGLPADRRFALTARADGTTAEGSFTLTVLSGDEVPARATGQWSEDGGQAAARLDLAASTLTRGLVRRFGPRATISVGGRRMRGGDYAIDGRAVSENLTVAFKGQADLAGRELTPAGLGVAATIGSVKRLAGGPVDGQARLEGVLRGDLSEFTLSGMVRGSGLTSGGYRLANAGGPVRLSRDGGEWTLGADLAGAGGQGDGYLAALLGARPTASVQASRLPDGRMLLRRVRANGAGLRVDATGQRGLLGGLSFEGEARFSNLAAARAGAGGAVDADWSARRPSGGGRPWSFTLDARGRQFSTGMAELDRLLGAVPRLRMRASYDRGRVAVAQSRLNGAVAEARAEGVMGADGALRFDLDWTAEGPFRAGPVEIAGDASGDGAITGTLGRPRAELTARFDQIDLPRLPLTNADVTLSFVRGDDGTNGRFALAAASPYGPARAQTAFRFAPGGVDLTELDADAGGIDASGALSLRRGRPSTADLTVAIGPGALLASGRIAGAVEIVDTAAGARADIDLKAQNAAVRGASQVLIEAATITAQGPLARLPIAIRANGAAGPGPWRIDGTGLLASQDTGYTLSMEAGGRVGRARFQTLEDAIVRFGGETRAARLRLEVGRGRATLDASLTGTAADVDAVLTDVALGAFNEDMAGLLDARMTLQGRGESLTGALDATIENARGRGLPRTAQLDGTVRARLTGDQLAVEASATNEQGLRANANVTLPVEASAAPFRLAIATRRPLSGRFLAQGEIQPLWDLFVGGERTLAGQVSAQGTLAGTLADPQARGQVAMTGGRFVDGATGLSLNGLALTAALRGEAIDVSGVTANDGQGGRLSGSGRISLLRDGVSNFRLGLNGFQVIDNDMATAIASGEATLNRDDEGRIKLTGELTIDRAEIAADPPTPSGVVVLPVTEINKPADADRGLEVETSRGVAVALDVSLSAPRRVFVRGRGLDVELSLDAHVGGTTRDPVLTGEARVVRGQYEFAGKRFEFDERGVVYLSADPEHIRLDLTATREDPVLTAIIQVRGTAARPEITLTSSPALPSDEVLSQVLFGASASQLSTVEAAQLAAALAGLAGGGGFDIIGGLRGLTGLDRLTFGGGESGLTVAGGKYLTDDVYLEIIGGGREGPVVQVEWRVRRNLAIVSRIASEDDARLSVRWRRDY